MDYLDHLSRIRFPAPSAANRWGMVAQGGNLSPGILLSAYEQGIFPWYEEEPIVWFSPDPRFVLYLDRFRIPRRFRRELRSRAREASLRVSADTAFERVISRCRSIRLESGEVGTWITPEMREAYTTLHDLGVAHSVEVWQEEELVAGLYGVATGGLFAGESMFSDLRNGSKYALVALVGLVKVLGLPSIDCQSHTDNLERFGALEIPRRRFLSELAALRESPVAIPRDWTAFDWSDLLRAGTELADRNAAGQQQRS